MKSLFELKTLMLGSLFILIVTCDGMHAQSFTGTKWFCMKNQTCSGEAVEIDTDGNMYLATTGIDQDLKTHSLVTKYDSNGKQLWTRMLEPKKKSTGKIQIKSMASDADGNLVIAGSTEAAFDGQVQTGLMDCFIGKFNPKGSIEWMRQLGERGMLTSCETIAMDSDCNPIVSGTITVDDLNATETFVIKFDQGKQVWKQQLTEHLLTAKKTAPRKIKINKNGIISIVGTTDEDYFISTFQTDGSHLWSKQMGVKGKFTEAVGVVFDGDDFIVGGTTQGTLDSEYIANPNENFFARYNSNGEIQWTKLFNLKGNSKTITKDFSKSHSGNIIVLLQVDGIDENRYIKSNHPPDAFVLTRFNLDGEYKDLKFPLLISGVSTTVKSILMDPVNDIVYAVGSTTQNPDQFVNQAVLWGTSLSGKSVF